MKYHSETKFTKQVRRDLLSIGASVEKVSDRYAHGRADLNVTYKGASFRLESKKDSNSKKRSSQVEYLQSHLESGRAPSMFISPENWPSIFHLIKGIHGVSNCRNWITLLDYSHNQLEEVKETLFIQKNLDQIKDSVEGKTNI